MARRNEHRLSTGTYVGLFILVIAALGVYSYGNNNGWFGHPANVAFNNAPATNVNQNGCPPGQSQAFLVSVKYPNYATTPLTESLAGSQSVNVYSQYPTPSTTPTNTVTSSSSGATAAGGLNCGYNYLITAGDQSTYFMNYTYANIGNNVNLPVTVVSPKISALSLKFSNFTGSVPTAETLIDGVGASQTVIGYVYVQAGQFTGSEGPIALTFAYNSLDIQSIQISGLSPSGAPVPAMTYVTSNTNNPTYSAVGHQNSQITYLIPSVSNYEYSTVQGPSTGAIAIPVQITTGTAFSVNEIIGVQATPATDFFAANNGSVLTGVYKNPGTNANLVPPVVTSNAIVLVT